MATPFEQLRERILAAVTEFETAVGVQVSTLYYDTERAFLGAPETVTGRDVSARLFMFKVPASFTFADIDAVGERAGRPLSNVQYEEHGHQAIGYQRYISAMVR